MKTETAATHEYPRSRALRQLRELIARRYTTGDWLPAEHELCARLSVSRGTLRSAIKDLENEGLLRAQAGRGRMVTSAATPAKTMMMDAVAVVTHERTPEGRGKQAGTDPFIQMSAIDSISRAGLHALMLQPDRLAEDGIRQFIQERPRGVVLMRRAVETHLAREVWSSLVAAKVPTVVYGDVPELVDFDSVVSDHFAGSYQLTKWLIEQGRRKILRMWQLSNDPPDPTDRPEWLARRDAGHEQAMREAGLQPLAPLEFRDLFARNVTLENFQAFVQLAVGQLLPYMSGPDAIDAIMVVSDGVLSPIAAACTKFGKQPGKEVLIVGYDNFWQDDPTRRWHPSVPDATVDKRNQYIGEQLVDLLLARMNGKLQGPPEHRLIQPELVIPSLVKMG